MASFTFQLFLFGALVWLTLAQTPSPEIACPLLTTSCDACIGNPQCFWCVDLAQCMAYSWTFHGCAMSQARYKNCWVNYEALLIAGGVVAGILLIGVVVGVCCCWCKCRRWSQARTQRQYEREQNELEHRHEQTAERNEQRRMERQAHTDQIRQKYGIANTGPAFQQLDNSQADTSSTLDGH